MAWRTTVALVALLVAAVCATADDAKPEDITTRIVQLKFASAVTLANAFSSKKAEPGDDRLREDRKEFLRRAIADATRTVRPLPQVMQEPGLYPYSERTYAEARIAQAGSGGGGAFAGLLPEGLSEPPTAMPNQNALIVKGTPRAIDEFQEIVALLDRPPKQVNIEVRLLNITDRLTRGQGMDFAWRGDMAEIFAQGPAPAGPAIRLLTEEISELIAGNRSMSRSNNSTGASVTTTNNTPCIIRAATVIPVVLASVTVDAFGQRHVDYQVDAVATGIELFALPRINADDSVSMLLRPIFIDATGRVVAPDGSAIPITEQVAVETVVRVPDGETVLIGGFPRSVRTLEAVGLPINFRESRTVEDVQSLLFVTPRIVRFIDKQRP